MAEGGVEVFGLVLRPEHKIPSRYFFFLHSGHFLVNPVFQQERILHLFFVSTQTHLGLERRRCRLLEK